MIYPGQSGGELRILSLLRRLKGRYRFSLMVPVAQSERVSCSQAARALEKEGLCKVHLVPRDTAPSGGPPWHYPESVKGLYDRNLARALLHLVLRENIPIVHLEFTEMAQYASVVRSVSSVVLTEHDASVLSWSRYYIQEHGTWSRTTAWLRRVWYERSVLRNCDHVIALSQGDALRLKRWVPADKVSVIPQGVALSGFPFAGMERRVANTILFTGYFGHYPNEEAALELAREILPLVLQKIPSAKVSLVGSCPGPAVLSLRSENVSVAGSVPEMRPFLDEARVFVAPLRRGYGNKTKILEAFASGVPVVTTALACETMPALQNGKHILVGRRPAEIARLTIRLLSDPEESRRLAENARAYVERQWDWGIQAQTLDRLYQNISP